MKVGGQRPHGFKVGGQLPSLHPLFLRPCGGDSHIELKADMKRHDDASELKWCLRV